MRDEAILRQERGDKPASSSSKLHWKPFRNCGILPTVSHFCRLWRISEAKWGGRLHLVAGQESGGIPYPFLEPTFKKPSINSMSGSRPAKIPNWQLI